jgi:hypothetical protein
VLDDPLLPVRLRAGGRSVGGAMAWGAPQAIRPFAEDSPFHGLAVPDDVSVTRQILAQLGPDLPERTWAALADGTPLVTAAPLGAGRVALFHVTANAEWSSLPLSGLFVDMVRRLLEIGAGGGPALDRDALAGRTARPLAVLDGFGRLADADAEAAVPAERLADAAGPGRAAGHLGDRREQLRLQPVRRGRDSGAGAVRAGRGDRTAGRAERDAARRCAAGAGDPAAGGRHRGVALPLRPPARRAPPPGRWPRCWRSAPRRSLRAQPADDAAALAATRDTVLAFVETGDPTTDG